MSPRSIDEQLVKFLTDVHSIEVQALAQMEQAPRLAGDPALAEAFSAHLDETREHERLVRAALTQRGADRSMLKDLAGRIGGWAMIAFAWVNPDTPGKLTAHAYSYEHMEQAAYALLERAARRAEDVELMEMTQRIAAEERAMSERLAGAFDLAVEASLRDKPASHLDREVVAYLRDAHAIETQALQLLRLAPAVAGAAPLAAAYREHHGETREHRELVEERLQAHDAEPSRLQDTALRVGGLNMAAFFAVQPDTPIKLAGFAYAFEHLEIASYELLRRVAERAADADTASVAARIADGERAAAKRIGGLWDVAMDAALQKVGVAAA
jgi:ferritin-like metal-binding protein YciE